MHNAREKLKQILKSKGYLTNATWPEKIRTHFEKSYQCAQTPAQKGYVARDMQDALWGLDLATDKDMQKVSHQLTDDSAVLSLFSIGHSTRLIDSLQKKIRPFLIAGALFSAGVAWHNHTSNLKTNPMAGVAAGLLAVATLSKIWQDTLPPYPEKPTFTQPPKEEPQQSVDPRLQLQKALMDIRKQQLDEIRSKLVNKELDTDELLVVELARYEQRKRDLDKATEVITKLSPNEIDLFSPYLKQPQDLPDACLAFARQKEKQQKVHHGKPFKKQKRSR